MRTRFQALKLSWTVDQLAVASIQLLEQGTVRDWLQARYHAAVTNIQRLEQGTVCDWLQARYEKTTREV